MTVELGRSALGHRTRDLARAGAREVPFLSQVVVRGHAAAPLGLPQRPNTWLVEGHREALSLGPDEWLLIGPAGSEGAIIEEASRALAGTHHCVVDVSANRAVFELTATDRHEMLSKGCALDLHPRSWRDGMCAQTLLARVPVILQERARTTRAFVRPSYADYVVDWLVDGAGAPVRAGSSSSAR